MPDQRSLTDQLKDLIPIAAEKGLYDAQDYLKRVVEERTESPTSVECSVCHAMDDDRDPCFPYYYWLKGGELVPFTAHATCAKRKSSLENIKVWDEDNVLCFERGRPVVR